MVNVATTASYQRGQARLWEALDKRRDGAVRDFRTSIPSWWPSHEERPYAFKAFAMHSAAGRYDSVLWCDASILPLQPLEPLWERIERDGYWLQLNDAQPNYEWTADSAYEDLWPYTPIEEAREENRRIPHLEFCAFGLSLQHAAGAKFLEELFRLAHGNAFCGPWSNLACPTHRVMDGVKYTMAVCGPADVRGHRHDQTAASVIAYRLGIRASSDLLATCRDAADGKLLLKDGSCC